MSRTQLYIWGPQLKHRKRSRSQMFASASASDGGGPSGDNVANLLPVRVFDAVGTGDLASVVEWLDAGGNLDAELADAPHRPHFLGFTMLMHACNTGHKNIVDVLLKRRASINKRLPRNGHNALTFAGMGGDPLIITKLLDSGALVDEPSLNGDTVLHHTSAQGSVSAVVTLLERGAGHLEWEVDGLRVALGELEQQRRGAAAVRFAEHRHELANPPQ